MNAAEQLTATLGEDGVTECQITGDSTVEVGGWLITASRIDKNTFAVLWLHALLQAEKKGLRAVLAYKQSGPSWRFLVRLADINPAITDDEYASCELRGRAFCILVKEHGGE